MATKSFEQAVELKQIDEHTFENVQTPVWSWPGTKVFPGGTLMVHAATAAYQTVGDDFALDTLQAHFLSGPDPALPLRYKVSKLSDGGRFSTRIVIAEQNGRTMLHVTCAFVRGTALSGPSMTYSVKRQSRGTIDSITLDDLDSGRNEHGPYMNFQRLPLELIASPPASEKPSATSRIYTSAACISPRITSSSTRLHTLGILALSDYHVLDAAPTLSNLTFGLPRIGDETRTPTEQNFKLYTSLNHTIHFSRHDGFRADDLCYVEVTSAWANGRRAEMQSRIFDQNGVLIASCVQEAYYVLKDDKERSKI